ncbi:MAG: outer membrane protein OmpA-like peptidoglycan-associated protein [Psychromonas sp.]|jgi:outer membrane protein OmpA-like peptidoglycan-associated protein
MNKLNYITLLLLTGCSTVQTPMKEPYFNQHHVLNHSKSIATYYQFAHDFDVLPAKPLDKSRQVVLRCIRAHKSTMGDDVSTHKPSYLDSQTDHHVQLQHYRMATPFHQNDAQLTQIMMSELKFFYQKLENISQPYHLFVLGHTNSDGSLALNNRLSSQRAKNALQYLNSLGVEHDLMTTIGMADSLPLATWDKNKHANNRRLEIFIYRPDNTKPTLENHCYERIL